MAGAFVEVVLADGRLVRVPRPPLGVLIAATYLGLWGITLAVLSIFTLVDAIAPLHELTFENLVIGFGASPVFNTLGACLIVAGYGFATGRVWAVRITRGAILASAILLTAILLLGAQTFFETLLFGLNFPLLVWTFWYAGRMETRRYLGSALG